MSNIIIAPWEWADDGAGEFAWQPPGGHLSPNKLGSIDFRSALQCGQVGPIASGFGMFVYDSPQVISGALDLGSDIERQLTLMERSGIELLALFPACTGAICIAIFLGLLRRLREQSA